MPANLFSRRHFLGRLSRLAPALVFWSSVRADEKQKLTRKLAKRSGGGKPTIGVALGAGGANGLAHILMLEALDEMAIRPHYVAGSSIGAIIGALFAAGMTGKQIRKLVEQFIIAPEENVVQELVDKDALRWVDFLDVELGNGGILSSENFITFLYDTLEPKTFEQLQIPLKIVAADLWKREQVVLQSGELLPAVKASMALPGVFQPVLRKKRVLVDGGTVNPVPYDLLLSECDVVIGIDVSGERTHHEGATPSYFTTVFNSAKVMQQAIVTEKLRRQAPAIYIKPRIVDIRALEFYRAKEVFTQAASAKKELKNQLSRLLPA
ncbi:MAG: patatin-like phospholipase family protein [Acidiferrobacterales bacterium]